MGLSWWLPRPRPPPQSSLHTWHVKLREVPELGAAPFPQPCIDVTLLRVSWFLLRAKVSSVTSPLSGPSLPDKFHLSTSLPFRTCGQGPLVLLSQSEGCPGSGGSASAWPLAFSVASAEGLVERGLSVSFLPRYL